MATTKEINHSHTEKACPQADGTHPNAEIEQGNGAVLLVIDEELPGPHISGLKLAKDGHTVLIPQPSDDPNDPLNWSETKKNKILITIGLAAFLADFQAAVGVAALVPQAVEWNSTPTKVNYATNLNVLLVGIGGVCWIPFLYLWGRAPVLFYVVLSGTLFTLGTCLVQDFQSYYATRALMGFTLTGGQTIGLAFIQDMYFFHQHARKIGIWTALFLVSPYCGPLFGYFILAGTGEWRPMYWMTFGLGCGVLVLVLLFADETWYRRDIPQNQQPDRGSRMLRLLGVWQIRVHKGYFLNLRKSFERLAYLLVKPITLPIMVYYLMSFMWAVGINQTTSILLPPPVEAGGYGFGPRTIGYLYFTPVVAVLIGECVGHWGNDWIADRYTHSHNGVFRPEARLYPIYLSAGLMVPGLILYGQALQNHLHWVALCFGWGMYVVGCMIASVAITAYALDSYPNVAGEVSGLINFSRIIGGFAVGYFQLEWGLKSGFNVSFGIQAAIVGASVIIVVLLHAFGAGLRAKGGPIKV